MSIRTIISLILIKFATCIAAQNETIDSLRVALQHAVHDTTKCLVLNSIIDSSTDDSVWPAYNEQMKKITTAQLKTIPVNDPLRKVYLKFFSIALSNSGYLQQM